MTGREWLVDAHGCSAAAIRDPVKLNALFAHIIKELDLHVVGEAIWHQFPDPGGITGMCLLKESHLTCHTFPEHQSLCLNLFCCKPRQEFNFMIYLGFEFDAQTVRVRRMDRPYGKAAGQDAA